MGGSGYLWQGCAVRGAVGHRWARHINRAVLQGDRGGLHHLRRRHHQRLLWRLHLEYVGAVDRHRHFCLFSSTTGSRRSRWKTREEIEAALDQGGLVWTKATVNFLPWAETTWLTPDGKSVPTVLGNDHAVVVMGYNDDAVVIRDVLGPTNTNWERAYEYDVPWETFSPPCSKPRVPMVLVVFPPDSAKIEPSDPILSGLFHRTGRSRCKSAASAERYATLARIAVWRGGRRRRHPYRLSGHFLI